MAETAKEVAYQVIERLPEEAIFDAIMYELHVRQKIGSGRDCHFYSK